MCRKKINESYVYILIKLLCYIHNMPLTGKEKYLKNNRKIHRSDNKLGPSDKDDFNIFQIHGISYIQNPCIFDRRQKLLHLLLCLLLHQLQS